jgi:hypothetical protein
MSGVLYFRIQSILLKKSRNLKGTQRIDYKKKNRVFLSGIRNKQKQKLFLNFQTSTDDKGLILPFPNAVFQ